MCLAKTPNIPAPVEPQAVKQPEVSALANRNSQRNRNGMAGGSLLTGPSGVAAAPTGKATLLGQ